MQLHPVALALLALPVSAQLPGVSQLVPAQVEATELHAVFDTQSAVLTMLPGIPVGTPSAPFTTDFSNVLEPASGPLYALLSPQAELVDWGIKDFQTPQGFVDQIVVKFGVDTLTPDLSIRLLTDEEGFGDNGWTLFNIPLSGIPADTVSPGNGEAIPVVMTIALSPPVQVPQGCIGWGYRSVGGGVGPAVVDTQCEASDFGPNNFGYEASVIPGDFTSLAGIEQAELVSSTSHDQSTPVNGFPVGFEFYGASLPAPHAQNNGWLTVSTWLAGWHGGDCRNSATHGNPAPLEIAPNASDFFGGGGVYQKDVYALDQSDHFVVSWEVSSTNSGSSSFQGRFFPCGNRIEFHYGVQTQTMDSPGAVQISNGSDPLELACSAEGVTLADSGFAITMGPLPMANGVTNKLDAYGVLPPAPAPTTALGDGSSYAYLGTGDFDASVPYLGAIASTYFEFREVADCGTASVNPLDLIVQTSGCVVLNLPAPPVFGSAVQLSVTAYCGEPFCILVGSRAIQPISISGTYNLWVDVATPLFIMAAPFIEDTATFDLVLPPYDGGLCGTAFHLQAGTLSPFQVSNAYRVIPGFPE